MLTSDPQVRVLLVDDHPVVRHALADLIGRQPDLEVCGEVGSKSEAMRLYHETRPQLVLIDVVLEDGEGPDLCKDIKAHDPNVKILVVSAQDDVLYAERALHSGALGYINKQAPIERILAAIRQVLSGRVYLSQEMSGRLLARTLGHSSAGTPYDVLSDREIEVFRLIGRGFSITEIAKTLTLSRKTVESTRERIKEKLHLATSTELIRQATRFVIEHP